MVLTKTEKAHIDVSDGFVSTPTDISKTKTLIVNIDTPYCLFEESSHYLNIINSNINFDKKRGLTDHLFLTTLIETIGFFGSKVLDPSMKNNFEKETDLMKDFPNSIWAILDACKNKDELPEYFDEYFIYPQGYTLGDILYFNYVSGKLSKKEIRNLFLNSFEKERNVIETFLKLRQKYWPIQKEKIELVPDKKLIEKTR